MSSLDLASLINLPWVESPFFDSILESQSLDDESRARAQQFHRDGFIVLDDILSQEECDRIIKDVGPLFDPEIPEGPRSRYRVQDAWREHRSVADLAGDERILNLLRLFYKREPLPFQTLNFLYGTEQPVHSDLTHFSCKPERFMVGVWVALEDITPLNGPLHYYVGSHNLPVFDLSDFNSSRGDQQLLDRYTAFQKLLHESFEYQEFHARKGQALVWAANLWHGGCPVKRAGATRHSQVTHYYFDGGFYYYPINSVPALGQYDLKRIVNVTTGESIPHAFNGSEIEVESSDGKPGGLRMKNPDQED